MFLIERRERKKHRIGARFCKLEYGQSLILTCCVVSNDSKTQYTLIIGLAKFFNRAIIPFRDISLTGIF